MTINWQSFKTKWDAFTPRDRMALIICGFFMSCLLFYLLLWQPLSKGSMHLREQVKINQKTLNSLIAIDKKIDEIKKKNNHAKREVSTVILLSELQKKISENNLDKTLKQLKQSTSHSIDIHFQKVSFDKLVTLLLTISKDYQISIKQFSTMATENKGIVNADIVLKVG